MALVEIQLVEIQGVEIQVAEIRVLAPERATASKVLVHRTLSPGAVSAGRFAFDSLVPDALPRQWCQCHSFFHPDDFILTSSALGERGRVLVWEC